MNKGVKRSNTGYKGLDNDPGIINTSGL